MDPVEVTARFDPQGKVTPMDFTWQGHKYPVVSTGRRWEDENGEHILVMVPGEKVYELVYVPTQKRWYIGQFGRQQKMV